METEPNGNEILELYMPALWFKISINTSSSKAKVNINTSVSNSNIDKQFFLQNG